jgi:hypothetical protein
LEGIASPVHGPTESCAPKAAREKSPGSIPEALLFQQFHKGPENPVKTLISPGIRDAGLKPVTEKRQRHSLCKELLALFAAFR